MARLEIKTLYTQAGAAVKRQVDEVMQAIGKELADATSEKIMSIIKEHAKNFKKIEREMWDALGTAITPKPGEFGSISGKLKKGTGYVITLNGVRISSSNTIVGEPVIRRMRFKGKEFNPHKKRDNQFARHFAVGIVIFSNVPYADFVNNPDRKKLKRISYYKKTKRFPGELYAGTGWFDIYTTFLTNMFYQEFLYETGYNQIEGFHKFKASVKGNIMQVTGTKTTTNAIINSLRGNNNNGIKFSRNYSKKTGKTLQLAKPITVKMLS